MHYNSSKCQHQYSASIYYSSTGYYCIKSILKYCESFKNVKYSLFAFKMPALK
jgi:hypothetical protein